ncbi:MAG: PKD domain-containing protein [Nanoarchaeota archaeon]|nr:PKD domain-containing protein [Nanoarchaeota archaeon]
MKSKLAVFVIICICSLTLAFAIENVKVLETDFVNLKVTVTDPDNDQLNIFYTPPLNEEGQWQTTYGDAGIYNISIRVSDGQLTSSKDILLEVEKKNEAPVITASSPEEKITIQEGQSVTFKIEASDINGDLLKYVWVLNGRQLETTAPQLEFYADYGDAGNLELAVNIGDGNKEIVFNWEIEIQEVDRVALLDAFEDITITETESVKLNLPDFASVNLDYQISAPLESGSWKTTFEDAGEYDITITITDRDFEAEKTITVTVLNNDRNPIFDRIGTIWINENDEVSFEVNSNDPDGTGVDIVLSTLPEGASFDGQNFNWKTNFETVQKDTLIEKIADKFHLLYYPFKLEFIAQSNGLATTENIFIWVRESNRPPQLADLETIQVVEGEPITLTPEASDPDGDTLKFTYEGWMTSSSYTTTFEDEGTHIVKVTASDGFLKQTKDIIIQVANVNRLPTATVPGTLEVKENQQLEFTVKTNDEDNNPTILQLTNPPRGMKLQDNTITWTPDYDVASVGVKNITVQATLSDGIDITNIEIPILIEHINRAPNIKTAQPKSGSKGIAGRPITFIIDAVDPDGDELTYTWEFGLLEKYNGTSAMRRTFTSPGKKKVKVMISDGNEKIKAEWEINIVRIVQQQPAQQTPTTTQQTTTQQTTTTTQQNPEVFYQFAVTG